MSILEAKDLAQRYKQAYESQKEKEQLNEFQQEIADRGGMDFSTGVQNILAGYNNPFGGVKPRMQTTTRRDGSKKEKLIEGYQLPSSLPDRPEDKGLELKTAYYDDNRGEFVYFTRSEPTRNRPQGMLKKNILYQDLEKKEKISELVRQGSSLDEIGRAIGVAELVTIVPALAVGGVKALPYVASAGGKLLNAAISNPKTVSTLVGGTALGTPTSAESKNIIGQGTKFKNLVPIERSDEAQTMIQNTIAKVQDEMGFKLSTEQQQVLDEHLKFVPHSNVRSPLTAADINRATKQYINAVKNTSDAAKKFNPNDKTTWQGTIAMVGSRNHEVASGVGNRRFVYGNDEVRDFFLKKYNETKQGKKPGPHTEIREPDKKLQKDLALDFFGNANKDTLKKMQTTFSYERGRQFINGLDEADEALLFGTKYADSAPYVDKRRAGLKIWTQAVTDAGKVEEVEMLRELMTKVKQYNQKQGLNGTANMLEVEHMASVAKQYDDYIKGIRKEPPDFSLNNIQIVPAWAHRSGAITPQTGSKVVDVIPPELGERTKGFLIENAFRPGGNTLNKIKALQKAKQNKTPQEVIDSLEAKIKDDLDTVIEFHKKHKVYADFSGYKGILPDEFINNPAFKKPDNYDPLKVINDLLKDEPGTFRAMPASGATEAPIRKTGKSKGGRIPFTKGGTDLDKKIKEYQDMGMELKDAIDEAVKDELEKTNKDRQPFAPDNESRVAGDKFNFFTKDLEQLPAVKRLQEDIERFYTNPTLMSMKKQREETLNNIRIRAREELRNERPVKFKASELANLAEEVVFKPAGALMTAPVVGALNSIEGVYNAARAGTENDIDLKTKFPSVYKLFDYYTSGIGPTPDDQTYIGFIDEAIRSYQKGAQNLSYSTLDLAFLLPDMAFDTRLQERLQKAYDENAYADPETFLGDAGAILTEFGVPSGMALKFINFMRRGLKAKTGVNLFTKSSDELAGTAKRVNQFSNVAKRVGVVAGSSAMGEFVGGSRYNTLRRMNPDDPLFLDQTLGYDFIDTKNMSGRELTVAELQNRFRFGAEGAIVGGMFPLVGPALAKATKYGVIKPSAYVAGKGLQAANIVAIKPVSYLLARTPGVAQAGQLGAKGLGIGARFLGKDVLSRAALGLMGTPTLRQLPEFKKWRMFEVTSSDPLERNLKRYDNFLSLFRDTANQSANRFFISGQTERGIKALSRKVEKQLDIVERRAYDLARGFLKDYNLKTTSPAKQEYYLDQVMMYLKGQIKNTDLPQQLQDPAKQLNKTFMKIKSEFADVLPDGAGLKDFLNTNLRQYMRASFSTFTNPFYRPDKNTFDRAVSFMVDRIKANDNMVQAAMAGARPGVSSEAAIRDFARKQVESILQRGKVDNKDPLEVLGYIARNNLKMDDLVIQTGEELPDVIRKLLGEENNLRTAVMTTATDLASQTANLQMYDKLADLGIREGWLFRSAEDAIAAGVVDPKVIGPRLPGLGKLNSKISEAYGGQDIVNSIVGTTGLLDGLIKNELYQSLIAYKAMVQTGKTVYSPATQTRNFGSAGFFPLQSGHIGGTASVQDAFKIMLDDIFGAGKTVNEQDLINRITRKIELGVLDENVVVSELKDILKDLKASKFKSLSKLSERIDKTKLSDTATRLYAGGDNVWKWYGHEFVMSQIKNGFKNVDELIDQYKKVFNTDINPATLEEGIEQYAATLIRETYPTYSKVPKLIQLIRRVPFIGNFVSFPAEILRTTFTTSALAAKHIASDNPTLRELGYRTLMGQFITYGGIGAGVTALGHAMTNVTTQQISDIKQYFAPEFMRFSDLVPISNIDKGVVKVFDNSRYFPYDLVTSTVGNLMTRLFTEREQLDPDKIETDMFKDLYNYTGPFADLAGGTLLGTAIGYEPALTFLTGGRTKQGTRIYSDTDTTTEKFDKMFAYTFNTINPGFIRTLQNLYKSVAGMLTGTGQPIKMEDEVFKVFGGSSVTIDVPGSFRYQVGNLKSSFREPKVAEDFFRPDFRNSDQLVREYNDMNEEAFREQYEFYKVVRAALRSNLMSRMDVQKILEDRVGKRTARNILMGKYTPLSYSKDALEGRFENVRRGNPNEILNRFEFLPFPKLDNVRRRWETMRFEDYEKEINKPKETVGEPQAKALFPQKAPREAIAQNVNPVPETGTPTVGPVTNVTNPATGLTTTETALLSPGEQAIRQKQRVTGVV